MDERRKKAIGISIAVICIVIVGLIIWFLVSSGSKSDQEIKDRDTGETHIIHPADYQRTGGQGKENTSLVLFGMEKFVKGVYGYKFTNKDFASDVRDAIYKYSDVRLQNKFQSITLRPQNLVINDTLTTGQLRLGQADEFADFTVQIVGGGKASITKIASDSRPVFYYVGKLNQVSFTATQDDYSAPTVSMSTYVYREEALKSIEALGYSIPDLKIKFTSNKNPFL